MYGGKMKENDAGVGDFFRNYRASSEKTGSLKVTGNFPRYQRFPTENVANGYYRFR